MNSKNNLVQKKIGYLFLLVAFFIFGYFLGAFKERDSIKVDVYAMAFTGFTRSFLMNSMLLEQASAAKNEKEKGNYECVFAAYYSDFNDFFEWMEKDRPNFWAGTYYRQSVDTFRNIAAKHFGSGDLKRFYDNNCYSLLGLPN